MRRGGGPISRRFTSPVMSVRGDDTLQGGWKAAGGPCGPTVAGAARALPDQRPMAPSDGGRGERSRLGWTRREGRVSAGVRAEARIQRHSRDSRGRRNRTPEGAERRGPAFPATHLGQVSHPRPPAAVFRRRRTPLSVVAPPGVSASSEWAPARIKGACLHGGDGPL